MPQTGLGTGFAMGGPIYTGDGKKVSGQYSSEIIEDGYEFFTE